MSQSGADSAQPTGNTSLVTAVKWCRKCGETKPLSEFHRNRSTPDGHNTYCKPCHIEGVKANAAKKRAAMGETAWLEHKRTLVKRSRVGRNYASERLRSKAQSTAVSALIAAHRKEYDALLQRAIYELESAEAARVDSGRSSGGADVDA